MGHTAVKPHNKKDTLTTRPWGNPWTITCSLSWKAKKQKTVSARFYNTPTLLLQRPYLSAHPSRPHLAQVYHYSTSSHNHVHQNQNAIHRSV
jgi:hypothetical protein